MEETLWKMSVTSSGLGTAHTDLQLYHGSILDLDLDDNDDELEFIHVADQYIKTM